jgi:hypothetical protein
MRNAYKSIVEEPEEKRPFGRPKRRWKNNNKIDLKERSVRVWTGFI